MNKSRLYFLGLITLIGFPAVGAILLFIFENEPLMFRPVHNWSTFYQLIIGLLSGTLFALGSWQIIQLPFLNEVKLKYSRMIQNFNMNFWDILFLSFCAGVGEELLFRGVIQPYIGIYITSIVFVAIHGYLNPKDWRITLYGVYMTLVIITIGYMNDYFGIISAIAAHFIIDVLLLLLITKKTNKL